MPLINIRNRKRELRAKYKRARASIPEGLKAELDKKLTERFLAMVLKMVFGNLQTRINRLYILKLTLKIIMVLP